jgi:predicted ATP-grasp superfamily ATP-dependent carboligase
MMTHRNSHAHTAVIVSGGGWPGAYDIVRSLGLAGVPTAVASSQRDDIAFYSRYVGARIPLPDFRPPNYERILESLLEFGSRQDEKPVLFFVGDSEVAFLHRYRRELGSRFRFLLPREELMTPLLNKALFYAFACKEGLPVPEAETFADASDLQRRIDRLRVPCIVKPAFNQDWFWETPEECDRFPSYKHALRRFDSKETLLEFCRALPPRASGFVVQSYIDGRDEAITSFHGYFDERSNCLGYFLGREVRTNPPRTGDSAYSQTFRHPELARLSIEYLQRIGLQGIVKIDYKMDGESKEFKIMEIEPHYQFWHLLGAYAGVNLPLLAYRHLRQEQVTLYRGYEDDLRMLYFVHDLSAFWRGYRKTKEWTLRTYLQSYARKKYYRVFDPLDPLPFVRSFVSFVRRSFEHLFVRHPQNQRCAGEAR